MLKNILKFTVATSLVLGGLVIGGTIFAAKEIDKAGDELQDAIH
ncbi:MULTISPECIES: hypothetical protein [Leuconostoc]|nr:hypothetical protein [Leuconostoc holzapfelii]